MTRTGTPLARAIALLAVAAVLIGACAPERPTSTLAPSAAPAQSSPTSPATHVGTPTAAPEARLTITGAGAFDGFDVYGCMASFLLDPGPGTLDRDATYGDPRFAVDRPTSAACEVSGPAVGAPSTIKPGTYRIGGAVSLISDVSSPGFSERTILGSSVQCSKEITVLGSTTDVTILVTFTKGRCGLGVTLR